MAISRSKKEHIVSKLSDLFKKADLIVFLGFRKLSVAKTSELRKKLREVGAHYTVAKKRLARTVLKNEGVEMPQLEGEIAFIASGKEPLGAAKEVYAFSRKNREETTVLGGIFSTKGGSASGGERQLRVIDAATVIRLAQIPPREILIAQVLWVMQGPMRGLVGVLSGPQRGLVVALKQIAERK